MRVLGIYFIGAYFTSPWFYNYSHWQRNTDAYNMNAVLNRNLRTINILTCVNNILFKLLNKSHGE